MIKRTAFEVWRLSRCVRDMYVYCRLAEYPCGRWYSVRAGFWWAWRMR